VSDPYHEWADRELLDEHESHPERFARYVVQPEKTMNTKPNDGGPAYPVPDEGQWLDPKTCTQWSPFNGMTLRDYFAAAALQGWLAGPCQGDILDDYLDDNKAFAEHQAIVAQSCYGYADAMLAAREL
jgi:hypothetical protein